MSFAPSAVLPVVLALSAAAPPTAGGSDAPGVQVTQLTIHQRIVIRVVPTPDRAPPVAWLDEDEWREKKGPRCVAITAISGALAARVDSVDLVVERGEMMRARFDQRCPAVDFYRGIYLRPTRDGMVCAGRDSLRARSGGVCRIRQFRRLIHRR